MKINAKLLAVALENATPKAMSFSNDRIQVHSREIFKAAQEYYACKWFGFDDEDTATLAIASILTGRSPLEVIHECSSKNFLNPIIVGVQTEYLGGTSYRIYAESGEAIPTAILREFVAEEWPHHTVSYSLSGPYLPAIKSEYDVFVSAVRTDDLLEPYEYESKSNPYFKALQAVTAAYEAAGEVPDDQFILEGVYQFFAADMNRDLAFINALAMVKSML